ncbi:MAG: glycoside hydrolase family 97 protein [Bacteroidetes bacterium]|nr:MAG: glycoside hydrolase family 97 protein [Bacteroidota bacterium]
MMKKILPIFILMILLFQVATAKNLTIKSPNGKITVAVSISDEITFKINYKNQALIEKGTISLNLINEKLGEMPKLISTKKRTIDEIIHPVVSLKNNEIRNHCNVLNLSFKGDYQLEFRVFDNGVAYRFITTKQGEITVVNESSSYKFADNYKAYLSKTERSFSNYEHVYTPVWLQDLQKEDLAIIPMFIDAQKAKVLITEADLHDYPAMFLEGGENNTINSWFPKYPEKTEAITNSWWADRRLNIAKEADYIARTKGNRTFPWRIFAIAEEDKDIVTNDLVYILSSPSEFKNFEWIKPGQTSWEWWHASNISGVDFKSGYNTKTYKYYIDFASHYGMEYMLMDEGWSYSVTDINKPNLDIDLEELVRYAKEKNVRIILWASWLTVENTPTFFEQVKQMGIAGVKIDFMDRSDQWMMNYYERIAKKAFENELLVDFHGSITPRGLRRTYPNIISYEGVTGMEQNKRGGFDTPNNHVILPFTRNVVGPMDYTPGAMNSVHPKFWHANWTNPMSIGTRSHQLALFIVFESGLQMLADNPSDYYKEDECTQFITDVPTTWDETIVLSGKIGEYIVVAKRKGEDWYIAGITNDKTREIEVDFSFLEKEKQFSMELFTDGINADKYATDYKRVKRNIQSGDTLLVKMMFDGGFAAKIESIKTE